MDAEPTPVELTPDELYRLRIALVVAGYQEAVVAGYQEAVETDDAAKAAWYRKTWPALAERFDRVHVELAEIQRAKESRNAT